MLGLDSQKVMLVEYDNEWVSCYESESKVIMNALGDSATDIQHRFRLTYFNL